MNKIIACILMMMMLVLTGCQSRTDYGECIGIADTQNPNLVYKVSTRNAVCGIIFIETLVVPIVVLNDQFYCPVGRRN
jgi:hypothetical protein